MALIYAGVRARAWDNPTPSETFDGVGMLMMRPGLALFLYGIRSIPGEGGFVSSKVLIPGLSGCHDR